VATPDDFHSKAAKATKGEYSVSDLGGLCGLAVKFVFAFAFSRLTVTVFAPLLRFPFVIFAPLLCK
jgi:hypothetical protein